MVNKSRLYFNIAKISQFASWPIIFLISHTFFRIHIKGKEKLRILIPPVIIIANHVDFYDSFILRLLFGGQIKHFPLRFMAVKKFKSKHLNFLEKIGLIGFIYKIFGVFVVVKGEGIDKGLLQARVFIKERQNVVIYPQGMIISNEVGFFQMGASVLALDTHAPVLPISFKVKTSNSSFRKEFIVNIGDIIEVHNNISSEGFNDILHQRVKSLYEQY